MWDLIQAVGAVLAFGLLFIGTAMFTTSISWFIGTATGKRRGSGRVNPLISTRPRRWTWWGLASLLAFIGLYHIGEGRLEVGVPVFAVGAVAAQAAAYMLGFLRGAERRSRRDTAEGLPLSTPVMPQGDMVVVPNSPEALSAYSTEPDPFVSSAPAAYPETASALTVEQAQRLAEAEGYAPARPHEN